MWKENGRIRAKSSVHAVWTVKKENKTTVRQLGQVSKHSFHFAFQNGASCAELKDTAEKRK